MLTDMVKIMFQFRVYDALFKNSEVADHCYDIIKRIKGGGASPAKKSVIQ